jgi:FlaA1/EpsC-like NDP-sugar epimerase
LETPIDLSSSRVLVTGACGTVGSVLTDQLLTDYSVGELVCVDNNESDLFFLEQRHLGSGNTSFFLGDVRDADKVMRLTRGVDVVFHAAAFKHVILCERSPYEAVQTNIVGVQNIALAAVANRVKRVIFTSSDKAVNPTSVMGTSKLMGERIITASNSRLRSDSIVLASTRFGNVLGSRGSVIPIFHEQIRRGGPVCLTDPRMTRFIMSIHEAVRLVIESAFQARGGEVFITKMPAIKIADLARIMIEELAEYYGHDPEQVRIEMIGIKPGEKLYEELMSQEETRRVLELERYFVVLPAFRSFYRDIDYSYANVVNRAVDAPYSSAAADTLDDDRLRAFLRHNGLLRGFSLDAPHPAERFWPDEFDSKSS